MEFITILKKQKYFYNNILRYNRNYDLIILRKLFIFFQSIYFLKYAYYIFMLNVKCIIKTLII